MNVGLISTDVILMRIAKIPMALTDVFVGMGIPEMVLLAQVSAQNQSSYVF